MNACLAKIILLIFLCYDVFEHVQNVNLVHQECTRTLKPNGQMFVVFPPFFQPLEAHLSLITKFPALNWVFSGKTLKRAYYEISKERGR